MEQALTLVNWLDCSSGPAQQHRSRGITEWARDVVLWLVGVRGGVQWFRGRQGLHGITYRVIKGAALGDD